MTTTYEFDESDLFELINEKLSNTDLETLIKAREQLKKEGKDTSIIDKTIKEKTSSQNKKNVRRKPIFLEIIKNLINTKTTIKKDSTIVKNRDHEEYKFEEELEEDDYYFEDDKN